MEGQERVGSDMFHNRVPWKKPRDDPGLKDQSSRDSRAALSRNKHGQIVQYVLQF